MGISTRTFTDKIVTGTVNFHSTGTYIMFKKIVWVLVLVLLENGLRPASLCSAARIPSDLVLLQNYQKNLTLGHLTSLLSKIWSKITSK